MNKGKIVELVIRRNSLSISELSRRLHVSRRSIYNWFEQSELNLDVICKIGEVLDHDFSLDFPDLFNTKESKLFDARNFLGTQEETQQNSVSYWRNKYINLLERHNEMLSDHSSVSKFI